MGKQARVELAAEHAHLDRDFVLLITTENPHQPTMCVEVAEDGTYLP